MSNKSVVNPPSLRFPFNISGKVHPEVEKAIRWAFNGLTNHEQAFAALKAQATSTTAASTATTTTTVAAATETITIAQAMNIIGAVNDQTGVTAYQTQPADYGAFIVFNDASPVAVSLSTLSSSPGIQLPWFSTLINAGAGTVTVTPLSGLIDGAGSFVLTAGNGAAVAFDGVNFTTTSYAGGGGGIPNFADNETPGGTINGTNVTFTLVHPPNPAGSLMLVNQGLVKRQNIAGDYTLAGSTITFLAAPTIGPMLAWYRY
jgi:hypothetical protein